jgi:hypothetical protein
MQIGVLNWFQIDEKTLKLYIFALIQEWGIVY